MSGARTGQEEGGEEAGQAGEVGVCADFYGGASDSGGVGDGGKPRRRGCARDVRWVWPEAVHGAGRAQGQPAALAGC